MGEYHWGDVLHHLSHPLTLTGTLSSIHQTSGCSRAVLAKYVDPVYGLHPGTLSPSQSVFSLYGEALYAKESFSTNLETCHLSSTLK